MRDIKIHILYKINEGPFGGVNQFLKALRNNLKKKGMYEDDISKSDVILYHPFELEHFIEVLNLKLQYPEKIFINRIDGPIYLIRGISSKLDKIIYEINHFIADGTVFQSEWSRRMNYKTGMKRNKFETLILNAPDSNIFNSINKTKIDHYKKIKLIATSWSSNWRKGFAVYSYLDKKLDFSKYEMTFIGNSPIKFKNIKWIKPLKSEDLALQLKQHDIYITASQNDPCSNSLIEALHCSLPAIALNEGGHPEIIGKAGLYFNNENELIKKIPLLVQNYEKYQKAIKLPKIELITGKYYEFMKKIKEEYQYTNNSPKSISYFKAKVKILKYSLKQIGFFNSIKRVIKNIMKKVLQIENNSVFWDDSSDKKLCSLSYAYAGSKKNISWLYSIKKEIPHLLNKMRGIKRSGFYHYSLTGDFLGEKIKWGLGNSVFFLKIIYTLGLEKEYKREVLDAIKFVLDYQRKDGYFYDPIIRVLSFIYNIYYSLKNLRFLKFEYKNIKRAETRQAISSILLFGIKYIYRYKKLPNNEKKLKLYLEKLNWELPWDAGSHFSHLLFFIYNSNLEIKDLLIKSAIDWVNVLQHKEDGFWYSGNPSLQQRINGAMKIMTGLKVVNKLEFKYAHKMIDSILSAINDEQACDNFNIVYLLKYCNELMNGKYRFFEIEEFLYNRLALYKEYYYPENGGFSFNKNSASISYYGAYLSRGKNEPDIHGTHLFLWGISIISQVLKFSNKLGFREIIP